MTGYKEDVLNNIRKLRPQLMHFRLIVQFRSRDISAGKGIWLGLGISVSESWLGTHVEPAKEPPGSGFVTIGNTTGDNISNLNNNPNKILIYKEKPMC